MCTRVNCVCWSCRTIVCVVILMFILFTTSTKASVKKVSTLVNLIGRKCNRENKAYAAALHILERVEE